MTKVTLMEATVRAQTRVLAIALAHYTSAVVMEHDNPYRRRCMEEALDEFEAAITRIREALAGRADVRGGKPEG